MPTSMLSSLARGYGTWTGSFDTTLPPQADFLPSLPTQTSEHRHGITVTPRSKTPHSEVPIAEDGHLEIPKTFVTRKGALMLFSAPEDIPQEPLKTPLHTPRRRRRKPKSVIDLSLKLKTLERLSLSVLQFGDQSYDKDSASVTDRDNPLVLNFLHHLEEAERDDCDLHSQPGGDLKFYLRDLKRRASCRGHGAGEGGIHRARSAELQEILDQLERAWPHRAESTFGGSAPAGDEFFYPSSPTPSVGTARSLSRSKVLSSQKLTASLKSLNYLGRPASTEPERTSVVSEPVTSQPDFRYGRSKSARPSVWITDSSTPIYLRPRVTPHSTIFQPTLAQSQRVPTPSARDGQDVSKIIRDGQAPVWLNVEAQENLSFISDDLQSQRSMADFELRGPSERGENQSGVASRSDRPFTPVKSERSATPSKDERSVMLSEAASVLSSLMEEEYLTEAGLGNVSDDELPVESGELWPGRDQIVESRASSRLTGVTGVRSGDADEEEDINMIQPLEPQYTALPPDASVDTEHEVKSQTGLLEDEKRDQSAVTPSSQHSADDEVIGSRVKSAQSIHKAGPSPSNTPLAADPDTLVSLHKDEHEETEPLTSLTGPGRLTPLSTSPKPDLTSLLRTPSPAPPSSTPEEPGDLHVPPASLTGEPIASIETGAAEVFHKPAPAVDTEIQETLEKPPATPKRRQQLQEKRTSLLPDTDIVGDVPDQAEEATADGEPYLSERVIKEREERERRAAQKKEEQERAAAEQQAEEDRLKQEAEDKKLAAEERVRQRVEEAARHKAEADAARQKKLEEGGMFEDLSTGQGKASKLGKKERKKLEGRKPGNDVAKAEEAAKTNATLDKLKAKSASGGEMDVEKLKQFMATQPPPPPPKVEKEKVDLPEHMREMFGWKTKSKTQEELEEEISRMKLAADQALGGSVLEAEGIDGLSAEDFASAQEALMEKIKKAEEEILEGRSPSPKPATAATSAKAKVAIPKKVKAEKGADSKKSPSPKRKKDAEAEKKQEQARKRTELKEQEKQEKQRRLEEAKALQQKIKSKEETRKAKEQETKRKAEELQERMEAIRQEEEEIEQAEKDARAQLAAVRKAQREEREARRKADLEKKKQEAIEKREKEKAMMETARQKEQEMLDRIADAEMARRLREEEEAKREEEEMAAQERFELEMKEAQRVAEEEEERLRDLERQAEEEAFQRLLDEKEQAEEKRWELEEQARVMREEAERAQREMLEEEKKLEEDRLQREAEEYARREEERARLIELQRLEEEAREKMRAQLEQRRAWALRRRDQNLAARAHLDAMRQSQGITDPWTFSYFVRWPKESYNRPMGQDPKKQRGFNPRKLKVKPPPGPPPDTAPALPAVDVSAVPK